MNIIISPGVVPGLVWSIVDAVLPSSKQRGAGRLRPPLESPHIDLCLGDVLCLASAQPSRYETTLSAAPDPLLHGCGLRGTLGEPSSTRAGEPGNSFTPRRAYFHRWRFHNCAMPGNVVVWTRSTCPQQRAFLAAVFELALLKTVPICRGRRSVVISTHYCPFGPLPTG